MLPLVRHSPLLAQCEKDPHYGYARSSLISSLCLSFISVVAADGLAKREVFRLPDPFAVITVDTEQTHTTSVIKKTLNPYWNENFDVYVLSRFFAIFPADGT